MNGLPSKIVRNSLPLPVAEAGGFDAFGAADFVFGEGGKVSGLLRLAGVGFFQGTAGRFGQAGAAGGFFF